MGRRGPKPAPAALKVLRGETRPSRVNYSEPQPVGDIVPVPDDLEDEAKAVWRRVVRAMGHTGVIRSVDQDVLRAYCQAVVRHEVAARLLASSGPLISDRAGSLRKNPLHQIVRENAYLVRQLAGELGLTPAARVSLHDANARPAGRSDSVLARLQAKRSG